MIQGTGKTRVRQTGLCPQGAYDKMEDLYLLWLLLSKVPGRRGVDRGEGRALEL